MDNLFATIFSPEFAFSILLGLYVRQELSVDRFHRDGERIYQLTNNADFGDGFSWKIADDLQNRYPEDFETFTKPQRLFDFTGEHENMPTMDAIIRKIDGKYYSFIKDERWEGETPEGFKAIRWTKSDNLTGPYQNPSAAVTDTWTEAQTLVANPAGTGWHLYVEHYPLEYYLYTAQSIEGSWSKREITSPDARHGSMIKIDGETMQAVKQAYKNR